MLRTSVALIAICLLCEPTVGSSAEVNARLSSGQAYVGSPITLQIEIEDAEKYEAPQIPEMDSVTIESNGAARRSSQTVIVNGRMSSTQSVVLQYNVTPQSEGTFKIPPLSVSVDGQIVKTTPLEFIALTSEVGDLMFVEIAGKQARVYVGEPLELVLKVWIQVYRDEDNDYTSSERDVWRSFSDATSWGPFAETLQELAAQGKRPGGEPVVRENSDGESQRYFLYEFAATIYPNKPGAIDASDVRVVVDYPVELKHGRNRSPIDEFFGGRFRDPFGGRLPGGGMDPAFDSPFGSQLMISKSRPISATASVDETDVIPIPTESRPESFQGAVGRYEITAKTDLRKVNAGDPITLQIGISGDGPLDSIQAPPLEQLSKGFRLDGQPLAGFVRDGVKYFTTTLRPIDETVSEVPPIEMSYFDPKTETFHTVKTSSIKIEVRPSDKLELDAIVGPSDDSTDSNATMANRDSSVKDWSPINLIAKNDFSSHVLENELKSSLMTRAAWFYGILLSLFAIVGLVRFRSSILHISKWFRSAKQRALNQLADIQTADEIPGILQTYVAGSFGRSSIAFLDPWQAALGQLRSEGHPQLAADLESLAYRASKSSNSSDDRRSLVGEAIQWIEHAETARASNSVGSLFSFGKAKHKVAFDRGSQIAGLLIAGLLTVSTTASVSAASSVVLLDREQQETLLNEANAAYQAGVGLEGDTAVASFRIATQKYQQLVDSDVQNSQLYANLANAYYQFGDMGRAIANYRLAMQIQPLDWRSQLMLILAQSQTNVPLSKWHTPLGWLFVGVLLWLIGLSMFGFGFRRRNAAIAVAALGVAIFCLAMVYQQTRGQPNRQAIVVANELTLRDGEGDSFEVIAELDDMVGVAIAVKGNRGDWLHVQSSDGQQGWVHREKIVEL